MAGGGPVVWWQRGILPRVGLCSTVLTSKSTSKPPLPFSQPYTVGGNDKACERPLDVAQCQRHCASPWTRVGRIRAKKVLHKLESEDWALKKSLGIQA